MQHLLDQSVVLRTLQEKVELHEAKPNQLKNVHCGLHCRIVDERSSTYLQ